MRDPSLFLFRPVRQFFNALTQKLAEGRVFRADPLDLGEERAEDIQSFVIHDPIQIRSTTMKDVAIKAVVTSADGFYYREEHEWRNLAPLGGAWLEIKMHELVPMFEKFQNNKQDDGLTATLSATLDGALQTDLVLTGISYQELAKFQRIWHKWEGELLGFSERMADEKDKKRGWRARSK